MKDRITLSYFYGREAEQYSFYKIPKLLFTEEYFKKISVDAGSDVIIHEKPMAGRGRTCVHILFIG